MQESLSHIYYICECVHAMLSNGLRAWRLYDADKYTHASRCTTSAASVAAGKHEAMEGEHIKMYLCFFQSSQPHAQHTRMPHILCIHTHTLNVYILVACAHMLIQTLLSPSHSCSLSRSLSLYEYVHISPGLIWIGFFGTVVVVTVVFAHSSGPLRF